MYYTIHDYLIDSEKFYANVTTPNCPVMSIRGEKMTNIRYVYRRHFFATFLIFFTFPHKMRGEEEIFLFPMLHGA